MKKAKSSIALLVVFVLLVVGFGVYTIVDKNKTDNDTETTGTTTPVEYFLQLKIEDVESLKIDNEDGAFTWETVVSNEDEEDEEDEFEFELVSPEVANLNVKTANAKANGLMTLRVDSEANANASNLADYGLDDPQAVATIRLKDGSEHVLEMGSVLRDAATKAYARLDDSNRVVVLSGLPNLLTFKTADLVQTSMQPFQLYEVDAFDFTRQFDKMHAEIVLMEQETVADVTPTPEPTVTPTPDELNEAALLRTWKFIEPFEWEADATDVNAMLSEFVAVAAKEVIATTIDDPATYGLDNPAYSYTLYSGDESLTISFGNEVSSGVRYMSASNRDELMSVNMSGFTLLDRPRVELVNSFVSLINIQDVGRIELTTPDGYYDMDVFHPSSAEKEEDDTLDYVYTINGTDATVVNKSDDYYFRKLYSGVLSLMVEGEDLEGKPEGEPVYSYSITKRTGDKEKITVDLHVRNDQSYYLSKNGEYTGFYTLKKRIDNETTNQMNLGLEQLLDRMLVAMDNAVDGKYIFPDD